MYKQFIKYVVIGASSLAIDFVVYFLLTRTIPLFHSHFVEAKTVSFFTSSIFNFNFNKRWTFDKKTSHNIYEVIKYYSVSFAALAINALLMSVFLKILGDLVAWLLVAIITAIINFILSRQWVFGNNNNLIQSLKSKR